MSATVPMQRSLRFIKLGGSLLDRRGLGQHFDGWLAGEQPALNLIIVGGGELVEAMRRLDALHNLPSDWLHELCIDLMQSTANLARILLGCAWYDSPQDLAVAVATMAADIPTVHVVAPSAYRSRLASLPRDWSVTSDSIAAHLAVEFNASELVLLKSTAAAIDTLDARHEPSDATLRAWSAQGIVDDQFPTAAAGLSRIRIVKL